MIMKYGLFDVFGILGVTLLVIAYLLLQVNKLQSAGLPYSLLNAIGASLIILSLIANFNLSAFLMEAFWVLISLIGVVRYLRRPVTSADVQL
jgi:hypothetical protein